MNYVASLTIGDVSVRTHNLAGCHSCERVLHDLSHDELFDHGS